MVQVTWFGHAAIGLEWAGGRAVLDPFSPETGLVPLSVDADIVACSHDNRKWHSYTDAVASASLRLDGLKLAKQPVTALGMRFSAITVGETRNRDGEPNAMICCEVGGLRMIHFGDLGHAVGEREANWLRTAPVWFALAGGTPTIDLDDLVAAWRELQPAVVIPIHYRTASLDRFGPLSDLLDRLPAEAVVRPGSATVQIDRDSLPATSQWWLMEPVCDPAERASAG